MSSSRRGMFGTSFVARPHRDDAPDERATPVAPVTLSCSLAFCCVSDWRFFHAYRLGPAIIDLALWPSLTGIPTHFQFLDLQQLPNVQGKIPTAQLTDLKSSRCLCLAQSQPETVFSLPKLSFIQFHGMAKLLLANLYLSVLSDLPSLSGPIPTQLESSFQGLQIKNTSLTSRQNG